jgi:hypothetical protein
MKEHACSIYDNDHAFDLAVTLGQHFDPAVRKNAGAVVGDDAPADRAGVTHQAKVPNG